MTDTFYFPSNPNLKGLGTSATLAINEYTRELQSQGKEVYRLGFGESPFPVPEKVVKALQMNAHQKAYLPVKGLTELRKAVAEFNSRMPGIQTRWEDVVIGPGSKELMFLLQLVTDADLILPNPCWVSYRPQAQILGRNVYDVATSIEGRYRMTVEALDRIVSEHPERKPILVMNYPGNPTGGSYTVEELKALADYAKQKKLIVLSDEIYSNLHHDGAHRSIAEFYPEGTILSSGLSKWCGAGGWRLGTFTFPPGFSSLRDSLTAAASETFSATSAPIQYAAIAAFQGGAEIDTYVGHSRRILKALGNWIWKNLSDAGVRVIAPVGGFYLFPDFSELRGKFSKEASSTSPVFFKKLLTDTGVALLPGAHFGRPPEELSARLAYVDFDGAKALEGARKKEGPLSEKFLEEYCTPVLRATEKIVQWIGK